MNTTTLLALGTGLLTIATIVYYKIAKAKRRYQLKRRQKKLGILHTPKLK